jgi:hypothetical protein
LFYLLEGLFCAPVSLTVGSGAFLGFLSALAQAKSNLWAHTCLSVCRVFHIIVTTVISDHIVALITLDTIVAFVIPLVTLRASSPVMWRKEHLWYSKEYPFPVLFVFGVP